MQPDSRPRVSLHDAQRAMAQALRDERPGTAAPAVFGTPDTVTTEDRLAVYRNNARQFFRTALTLTYPVLQRRVGEDFFRQLAAQYRDAHPSRSGDLHWAGAEFPRWLAERLRDTEYAWLADLARLEWACEEAAASAIESPASLESLATVPPEALDAARVRLQPSLRLVDSPWPIWSIWHANQHEAAPPVELAKGAEHCACVATAEAGVAVFRLEADDHALLVQLLGGAAFAEALSHSGTSPETLTRVLEWAFAEQIVVGVSPSAPA